jgi:hypothetical protein
MAGPPDDFSPTQPSLTNPYTYGVDITTSDSADLAFIPRAITCRVAGLIRLGWPDGTTSTHSIALGIPLKMRPTRVYATTTTATGIAILK